VILTLFSKIQILLNNVQNSTNSSSHSFFAPSLLGQEVTYHIVKSYDKDGVLTQNDTLFVNHRGSPKIGKSASGNTFIIDKKIRIDSIKELLKNRKDPVKIAEFVSGPIILGDSLHFEASKLLISDTDYLGSFMDMELPIHYGYRSNQYQKKITALEKQIKMLSEQIEKINRRLKKE